MGFLIGILHVTAEEKTSGSKNQITITNDKSLPQEDINRMIKDAQQLAEEDRKVKERVESWNALESTAYMLKRDITEKGPLTSKLSQTDANFLLKIAEETTVWLDEHRSATMDEIKQKWKDFERLAQIIINKLDDTIVTDSFWPKRNVTMKSEL